MWQKQWIVLWAVLAMGVVPFLVGDITKIVLAFFVVRTAVGEANVVERMKALAQAGGDVVVGGEGNGGVIDPRVHLGRDSLVGIVLLLEQMAKITPRSLSAFANSCSAT